MTDPEQLSHPRFRVTLIGVSLHRVNDELCLWACGRSSRRPRR